MPLIVFLPKFSARNPYNLTALSVAFGVTGFALNLKAADW